jgi:hypothetical protein
MIAGAEINLEDIDEWEGILVLDSDRIQRSVVHT